MSQDAAGPLPGRRHWWQYVAVGVLTLVTLMGTIHGGAGTAGRTDVDALAIAIALVCPLSLLLLRWRPVLVLGVVVTLCVVYLVREYPYGPVIFSLVVVLIGNLVLGKRMPAWIAGGIAYVGLLGSIRLLRDEWSWQAALGLAAWVLLVLLLGEFIRVRVERVAASREARAETERRQANEERLRIARELHDVVAHHMSLINVQAGVALHLIEREPERVAPALETIKNSSKEALGDLRSLIDVLRESDEAAPRQPAATLRSLDPLIERSAHAGLTVRQNVTGTPRPLPSAVEMAAHRIIQEAITNVVRHADADRAAIDLDYGTDMLTLRVDDNGHVDPARLQWGNGLRGMQERASTLGGDLEVGRAPAGGVRVQVTLRTDAR